MATTLMTPTLEELTANSDTSIATYAKYFYHDFWEEFGDPRVTHLPLIHGGPWKTIAIVLGYLAIVRIIGPRLMKNREPFDVRIAMIVHNGYLAIGNGLGFLLGLYITKGGITAFACEPIRTDQMTTYDYIKIYGGWLYFFSKFVDFLDTFFFVMRKKSNQVSPLHVFHHGFMPIACYIGLKFIPGGNIILIPLVNTGIHAIMYTYYGLAAIGPHMQPYLWWKKYITLIQVLQFILFAVHSIYGLVIPNCSYPKFFSLLELFYAFVFFDMFFNFYKSAYTGKSKSNDKKTITVNNNTLKKDS